MPKSPKFIEISVGKREYRYYPATRWATVKTANGWDNAHRTVTNAIEILLDAHKAKGP